MAGKAQYRRGPRAEPQLGQSPDTQVQCCPVLRLCCPMLPVARAALIAPSCHWLQPCLPCCRRQAGSRPGDQTGPSRCLQGREGRQERGGQAEQSRLVGSGPPEPPTAAEASADAGAALPNPGPRQTDRYPDQAGGEARQDQAGGEARQTHNPLNPQHMNCLIPTSPAGGVEHPDKG